MRFRACGLVLATLFVSSCSQTQLVREDDADASERVLDAETEVDADPVHFDAAPVGCSTPNPTRRGDSGTYCVRHLRRGCFDETFSHVCVEGSWQCPEPDMILVRDCESFGNSGGDIGGSDFGAEDAGGEDVPDEDGGGEDATDEDASDVDADHSDVPSPDK